MNAENLTVNALTKYLLSTYGPDARVDSFSIDIKPEDAIMAAKIAQFNEDASISAIDAFFVPGPDAAE